MKLRSQMLLAGALTLAVPLVGWQSVKQLYSALQQTRIDEQTLKVANMRLALSESRSVESALMAALQGSGKDDWYAQRSPYPLFVDGYEDDWQELVDERMVYTPSASGANPEKDLQVSVLAAKRDEHLYLFIHVIDDHVIYHSPPLLRADAGEGELPDRQTLLVNGDSAEILVYDAEGRWQHGLLRAIAPGPIQALHATEPAPGLNGVSHPVSLLPEWEGAWQSAGDGYTLEVKLPLPVNGAVIALAVVDVDYAGEPRTRWAGSLSPRMMKTTYRQRTEPQSVSTTRLFHDSEQAADKLDRWTTPGVRTRLFDVHGRLQADVNRLYALERSDEEEDAAARSSEGLLDALLLRVFAFFVAGDLPLLPERTQPLQQLTLSEERRASIQGDVPVTSRYVTAENDRVLGTLAPVNADTRLGYLLFEANEEHASAYAGSELARLFSLLLLVSLAAGSGLLIFAFVLSSRIRRLSREATAAISVDGRVTGLPGSEAQDEIGDLSRNLSSLLSRSASYTHYLEALASRLSHELRTPLSVVRTSLENLDTAALDEQSRQLIDRASGGAEHLGSIIKALVESTRLEQSVQRADRQIVRLDHWLQGALTRYQQVYPETDFLLDPHPVVEVSVLASPELLQQAFDKLVDNAVGFATHSPILLHLSVHRQSSPAGVTLAVINQGEMADDVDLSKWFEPLYSQRQSDGHALHLGLGLYIVKMIAEAHGGTAFAGSTGTASDQHWIRVGMRLRSVQHETAPRRATIPS